MRRVAKIGVWAVAALFLSACLNIDNDTGNECVAIAIEGVGDEDNIVTIDGPSDSCDQAYTPPVVIITQGDTLTWTNNDTVEHTVTSSNGCACDASDAAPDPRVLDSGVIAPGGDYSVLFSDIGSFDYVCAVAGHKMRGRVVVLCPDTGCL
jgi:plastocyanin